MDIFKQNIGLLFYQCFIRVNKLLEEKQKNTLIVQDDHNIIKHNEAKKEEIFQVNAKLLELKCCREGLRLKQLEVVASY